MDQTIPPGARAAGTERRHSKIILIILYKKQFVYEWLINIINTYCIYGVDIGYI